MIPNLKGGYFVICSTCIFIIFYGNDFIGRIDIRFWWSHIDNSINLLIPTQGLLIDFYETEPIMYESR